MSQILTPTLIMICRPPRALAASWSKTTLSVNTLLTNGSPIFLYSPEQSTVLVARSCMVHQLIRALP